MLVVVTPKSYNGKDVSFCVFAPYKKCKKGKNTCSFIQFNCLRHTTATPSALVLPTLEHISTAIRAMLCSTSWPPSRNLNLGELIFPFSFLPPHFFFFLFFVVNLVAPTPPDGTNYSTTWPCAPRARCTSASRPHGRSQAQDTGHHLLVKVMED